MFLTFAHAAGAVLAGAVLALTVVSAVLWLRIRALSAPKLEAVGATGGPGRPLGPVAVDCRALLVARLLLHRQPLATRTVVDGGRRVAGSSPLANTVATFAVALGPLAPLTPLTGNYRGDR